MDTRIEQQMEALMGASPADPEMARFLDQHPSERETLTQMQQQAKLIREALRVPAELAPAPGFYARVLQRIEEQQGQVSFWSVFTGAFGRRLVYASAALIVLLSVAMLGSDSGDEILADAVPETPAVILVDDRPDVHLVGEPLEDRGRVFVSLTAIEQ
jgi:hypothetical protein